MANVPGPVFFDHCVLDALAMLDQLGLVSRGDLGSLLGECAYLPTAFIFPPWEEIYTTDAERDHTFTHAVAVHGAAKDWYQRCGYELVEVPRGTVQERCNFILARVA